MSRTQEVDKADGHYAIPTWDHEGRCRRALRVLGFDPLTKREREPENRKALRVMHLSDPGYEADRDFLDALDQIDAQRRVTVGFKEDGRHLVSMDSIEFEEVQRLEGVTDLGPLEGLSHDTPTTTGEFPRRAA